MSATTPRTTRTGIAYLDGNRVRRAMYAGLKRVVDDQDLRRGLHLCDQRFQGAAQLFRTVTGADDGTELVRFAHQ